MLQVAHVTATKRDRHYVGSTKHIPHHRSPENRAVAASGWSETMPIPRVDAAQLTRNEFRRRYVDGEGKPVILTGLSALADDFSGIEGLSELVGHCR